jgi:hypothetical protein
MKHRLSAFAVAGVVCMLASSAAQAQSANVANTERVYRLNDGATFQQGCWDPCDCPLQSPLNLRGTMVLGPTIIGNAFDFRDITNVNWYVSDDNGNDAHTITGAGTYIVTNWPGEPPQHALALELQVDGGETQSFWSELEPVTSNDGSFDIQVTMNGMVCYDIVLQVDASPVPQSEVQRYRLGPSSTYQQGCWDPCDCPLWSPVPLSGTFSLVPLRDLGTYMEFAVVNMDLSAFGSNEDPQATHLSGAGLYTLIAGFAGMIESLELELSINGEAPTHFESGFINSGEEFPDIDIDVSMNGMVCFDIVLGIRAEPKRSRVNVTNAGDAVEMSPPNTNR